MANSPAIQKSLVLALKFKAEGKSVTLNVLKPLESLDGAAVKSNMETIIAAGCYGITKVTRDNYGHPVQSFVAVDEIEGAEFVQREVDYIDFV